MKVNYNIDYFSIYMHLFGGNLPGRALKLTQCELVLDLVKGPNNTDTETNIVHFTLGQPGMQWDLHLIGLWC